MLVSPPNPLPADTQIKNRIGGLGQHYGGQQGCGYENLKIMIIEKVEDGNPDLLARREIFWQNQLRCFMENGGSGTLQEKREIAQLLVQINKLVVFHLGIENVTYFCIISLKS